MAELISAENRKALVNGSEVLALSGSTVVTCMDLGVWSLVRQLVRTRGLWPTTYYTTKTETGLYTPPTDEEWDQIEPLIADFLEDSGTMGTCTELSDLISQLTTSVSASTGLGGCANGSGGAGYGDDVPLEGQYDVLNPDGDPPAGFADWDEYRDYKCWLANHIYDLYIRDVSLFQTQQIAFATAATLAGSLSLAVPGGQIVTIVGLVGGLSATVLLQIATDIKDALNNREADLECALFTAITPEAARDNFLAILDEELEQVQTIPGTYYVASLIAHNLTSLAQLNCLFERCLQYENETWDYTPCTGCGPICSNIVHDNPNYGTWIQDAQAGVWTVSNYADGITLSEEVPRTIGNSTALRFHMPQPTNFTELAFLCQQNHAGFAYDVKVSYRDNTGVTRNNITFQAFQAQTWLILPVLADDLVDRVYIEVITAATPGINEEMLFQQFEARC